MTLDEAAVTVPGRRAVLARAHPAAKLGVALVVSLALLLSVDVVTAGTALLLESAALPWCGLGPADLWRRTRVAVAAALLVAASTAFLGVDSGPVLLVAGPLTVTQGSLTAAAAIALRVLAIAVPGVVLLATTDPTDLADALAQVVRLPERFVLAALAAFRLFGVMTSEWEVLRTARRARGLGDGGPLGRVRTGAAQVLALLVLTLRRATVLAVAMEARGFGTEVPRTWARSSRMSRGDVVVLVGGVAVAAVSTTAGVTAGTWQLL